MERTKWLVTQLEEAEWIHDNLQIRSNYSGTRHKRLYAILTPKQLAPRQTSWIHSKHHAHTPLTCLSASGRRKDHAWSTRKTSDSFPRGSSAASTRRRCLPSSHGSTAKTSPPSKTSSASLRYSLWCSDGGMPAAASRYACTRTKSS